jgi:hypothetical protein
LLARLMACLMAPVVLSSAQAASPGPLACSFKLASPAKLGGPVKLWVQLLNTGKQTLWVLPWNSPLEGLFNAYLQVLGPQGELPYQGPMIKRGAPSPADYLRVAPGHSLSATLDLKLAYDFQRSGAYEVRWESGLIDHHTGAFRPQARQGVYQGLSPACAPLRFELRP